MSNLLFYSFTLLIIIIIMADFYPKYLKKDLRGHLAYLLMIFSIIIVVFFEIFKYNGLYTKIILDLFIYIPSVCLSFYINQNVTFFRIRTGKLFIFYFLLTISYIFYLLFIYQIKKNYLIYLFPILVLVFSILSFSNLVLVKKNHINLKLFLALLASLIGYLVVSFNGNINWWIIGEMVVLINIYIYENNRLIYLDNLTGLYNRKIIIDEKIDKKFNNLKVVLYYIDLNDFKQVNDKYGHQTGDIILQDFAKILKGSIRERDYAIRLGGDEFLLVTGILQKQNPNFIIKRINNKIAEYNRSKKIKIYISVGYEIYNPQKGDFNHHLFIIDQKMYKNKQYHRYDIK